MVCTYKQVEKEVVVNVCKCVPKEETYKCTVMTSVPQDLGSHGQRLQMRSQRDDRQEAGLGMRAEKKKVKETYYVQEPYETTIKVAVGSPCSAPCGVTYYRSGCCR